MSDVVSPGLRLPLAAVVLISVWGCASTPPSRLEPPLVSPPRLGAISPAGPINTIVIDAGHGGQDPGTSHFGLKEKHLALDIAKRLRGSLRDTGLTVVMTRETDQFIPLSGRPGIANRLGADLFVSVHINANRDRSVGGIEVYYPRESVVSSAAQWPPSVSPQEIGIPSTTVREILWDLVLGQVRSRSRRLASSVCRAMRDGAVQVPCRTIKPARFVILREAWMPAVLVEVGYVTNQAEAARLGTAEYRQALAECIAEGLVSYIRDVGAQHI